MGYLLVVLSIYIIVKCSPLWVSLSSQCMQAHDTTPNEYPTDFTLMESVCNACCDTTVCLLQHVNS